MGTLVWFFYIFYYSILLMWSVAVYVLYSLALQTIAKRRGIPASGLAWVPIASAWVLGKVADDYKAKACGEKTDYANKLLKLTIVSMILLTFVYVFCFSALLFLEVSLPIGVLFTLLELAVAVPALIFAILLCIAQCKCIYWVFRSCDPANSILFTVLGLVFTIYPIFFMIVRNKDLGMPETIETIMEEPTEEAVL